MANGGINSDLIKDKGEGENSENNGWSTLLPELLGLVMSGFIMKDIIHISLVCKGWYKSCFSIHMKNINMWFMKYPFIPRIEGPLDACELYDSSQDMTYKVDYPEIARMTVCYSKDGWLLVHKNRVPEMFFFNPFTRRLINLPTCKGYIECAIFTCAPTSDSCLVFGLTSIDINNNILAVNTFRFGESGSEWKIYRFMSPERYFACNNKIIFSRGLFYCLGGGGSLAVFDPSKQTWSTHCLKYEEGILPSPTPWFAIYFIEIKGDVFLLKNLGETLQVFQLNRDGSWFWEKKDRIEEGLTIFGADYGSEFRSDLANDMKNKLHLSNLHGIRTYIFDGGKYLPSTSCFPSWDRKVKFQAIWIDPPKQCLDFI